MKRIIIIKIFYIHSMIFITNNLYCKLILLLMNQNK